MHSSILAQEIPQTEEPGKLQSMEQQRAEHDRATNTHMIFVNRKDYFPWSLLTKHWINLPRLQIWKVPNYQAEYQGLALV